MKIRQKDSKMTSGGRNLVILGILSVLVASLTTGVSLAIYHNSGDIYLDRSRPGFLPDEDEIEKQDGQDLEYNFEKSGKLTIQNVEEYLEKLELEIKAIDAYSDPFNEKVLIDEELGITEKNNES
ncbi:hypothetical protein J6S37_02960 [Candidatus Saccharibacteria bacterium]|nr:hypothetical protein [Candidatus Saccharibacteria bacterium]MBO7718425.1 hypothetical protein [Candidatus Saccharibacteria bacterium]